MMRPALAAAALAALATSCTSDDFQIVTVTARPSVRGATSLAVTLSNGGTTRQDTLALAQATFPLTFSVSTPGRSGDLAISADALDAHQLVVGRGAATTTTGAATAELLLDSADFVVNTDFADDQFPADDFEAAGFQLAALPTGAWTAAFRDACPSQSCTVFGRRFDANGAPIVTAVSGSDNAFAIDTRPTTSAATPAVAAGATTTLAVWDFYDAPAGTPSGVACRTLAADGTANAVQGTLASDAADVVALAALTTGNFVASWNASIATAEAIRAVIIQPDCTALGPVLTVSTTAGFTHRSAVGSSGDRVLFTWIIDGVLYARMMTIAGTFTTAADVILANKTTTDQVVHARIAPVAGGGFVVAARWAQNPPATGAGRIELLRVDATGARVGTPSVVTTQTVTDADNRETFSLAAGTDGSVLVAWHTCGELGDKSGCGVFGRRLRDTGEPLGDVFNLATTTTGDQRLPSVAALPAGGYVAMWSDASATAPDTSNQSVRARILY